MARSLFRKKPYKNPDGDKLSRLKKGDRVQVMTGKFIKKIGLLKSINHKDAQVIIESVNMVTRNHKGNARAKQAGGRMQKEAPIALSNVSLVCPRCMAPTRIGIQTFVPADPEEKKKNVRVCKRCKARIDD
ncbi:MAG: 50S ribosomal protein L24 [Deltaproteobacteria bacterium]|jgi:large subunit ribosomal protein L24|nr:50S ribosomal protein L24 [Deltaproteobacteria bacterium]